MAERPLLLLDVDGVLLPLGDGPGEEMTEVPGPDGPVRYPRATPERLARLSEVFSFVWATAWQRPNDVLSPVFGLPSLPLIDFAEARFRAGQTWKLTAIRQYVGARPFAWVDDEIGRDARRWAERRSIPTLLVDVRADHGLTHDHVDALLMFGRSVVGGVR